jgi:hypothetical protein
MRLEDLIRKDAVAPLSGMFLEWQGDQIPESAFRQRVLARKEAIVRIQSDLVAIFHRPS